MILQLKEQEAADAAKICDAGWRQGAVLDPRTAGIALPERIKLSEEEYLIICTQSCSVVSSRFSVDPEIELMAVKPLQKFKDRAPEATGRNVRKLHVPLLRPGTMVALECDLNRRFQYERTALLNCKLLEQFEIGEQGAAKLAAWLGRSYTRIALPNKLVECMRAALLKQLEQALATPYGEVADPVHYQVPYIYLKWDPTTEDAEFYTLNFLFICDEYGAAGVLEEALQVAFKDFTSGAMKDGIVVENVACQVASETFLTDLDGFDRFSEWDYLSNLADVGDVRE